MELKECEDNGFPTFIYGGGEGALNVQRRASTIGFKFAGKLVDRAYYTEGCGCACLEDIIEQNRINLVVAHRGFSMNKMEVFRDNLVKIVDRDCFSGNYDADSELMTFEFVKLHDGELTRIYNSLADSVSKESLVAYLNQKISMDYSYLRAVKSDVQYFDPDIVELSEDESLLDAGAYIGDTVKSFLRELRKQGIGKYKAIYAFEPDAKNYNMLQFLGVKNLYTFDLATSDHKDTVGFSSVGKGSSSVISNESADYFIKMDTIDDVLDGKSVTFIKMDVEGYELASLKGAERIIRTQKPKLAICIYHKKCDLWEIEDYISSIVPEYKFYMRAYEDTATELVLYAII
jgi:FkbM family methyltransferase